MMMTMRFFMEILMAHNTFVKLPLFILSIILLTPGSMVSGNNNQDPDLDYLLDDSYMNLNKIDRSEVERLLREYPSNQDLVRNIGPQYQFVNVVQIRHHQVMGLSTREGTTKGPRAQAQVMQNPQQSRIGKHFHRTSFLIEAFNHKFRLILELNPTLIAPNVVQTHILNEQTQQRERTELEMCYYHGIVEGLEWSAAAVRTCNGLSGIIHMGNETFVIHPFAGGDLSYKHPHIVFEAKSLGKQVCGNKRGLEYNMPSTLGSINESGRKLEDGSPKYFVELALLLDRAMFDKRNGSTRLSVVHDALQIVNIADLYFRKISTAISVVYVETWMGKNHLQVDVQDDLRKTLLRLTDIYGPRHLFGVMRDSTMLLSGLSFSESGMGVPMSICTAKAMGVVTDVSMYQPHITGVALAHMIGHNLNMGHDHDSERCHCPTWYGCIMNENIIGNDGIHPYIFSDCSRRAYFSAINSGHAMCLINRPNAIDPVYKSCGNGIKEPGEECDCGSEERCQKDPCCERLSCRLKTTAECSSDSPCCEDCKFKKAGSLCRDPVSECDIPEFCSGTNEDCPTNIYKKNGSPCSNNEGYCFNGYCPTYNSQCFQIWGHSGKSANHQCYDSLNINGDRNGHCGKDNRGNYKKCDSGNTRCGTLQCKEGSEKPTLPAHLDAMISHTRTFMSQHNSEPHECKSLYVYNKSLESIGLVHDGTKCSDNRICMNQTCQILSMYIDRNKCPSNNVALDCSGHGDCSNANTCYCNPGWEGPDCHIQLERPPIVLSTLPPTQIYPTANLPINATTTTTHQPGKETKKPNQEENGSNTTALVFGMVSVVGGVFILFAMLALCYRRSTVPKFPSPQSSYPPFNPQNFKLPGGGSMSAQGGIGPPQITHEEIDNRILSFTQLPAYRDQHSSLGVHGSMKNLGVVGNHDDEMGDETSAFLGTPNSLGGNRFPEKGILKKYNEEDEGSQSDNNEGLCDVERTLKSLNGYHEDIIAALRIAAAQRGISDLNSPPPQNYSDYHDYTSDYLLRNSANLVPHSQLEEDVSDDANGPLRIRNLEDLLRQLEHHTGRHLSPCGSDDLRMSETEADRHYRGIHSANLGGDLEDDGGFVMGRYRGPVVGTGGGNFPHARAHSQHRLRSPLSDYGHHFSGSASGGPAASATTPDDDLDSTQMNLLNTSTSEEDDDHDPTNPSSAAAQIMNVMKPTNYNPSEDSYGSESPTGTGPRNHHHHQSISGIVPSNY